MVDVCIHCGVRPLSSDAHYCYECGERLPRGYEEQAADATSPSPAESGWGAVLEDLREIRRGHLPVHVEVVARITASSFLSYVLALGDFSDVVPSSQWALIGMLVPLLSLLMPTLLFSVGAAVFPPQMIILITALGAASMLLACAAAVGTGFYVFAFGLCSLFLSGTRFNKSTGTATAVLIMQMALNTQGFATPASEHGISFVSSLWKTEGSSIANPEAVYVSSLVGMMWVCLGIVAGRVLPPFRTMRRSISKFFLPSALRDVVAFVYLGVDKAVAAGEISGNSDDHYEEDEEEQTMNLDEDKDEDKGQRIVDSKLAGSHVDDFESRREVLVARLVHDVALLASDSNIAVTTAFEPRLLRFGPQECSYLVLGRLCDAVSRCALSVLAVSEVMRDRRDEALQRRLAFSHRSAAATLSVCAAALEKGVDPWQKVTGDGGGAEAGEEDRDDKFVGGGDCGADVPCLRRPLPVDPIFLTRHSKEVEAATGAWAETMGPPDYRGRSFLDKDARSALKSNITPWVGASTSLWLEIGRDIWLVFRAESWKRIVKPPYYDADKFMWCVKFAVGFTALVVMGVSWQAFRDLELPVMDDGMLPTGAHFSGWYLIAYAMSTTQTVEGTVKKGLLRILGTAAGGFSGWLAITACGSNVYGLIAWATIFTSVASYYGLPRGLKARFGMDPDLGYGPGYFVMTQALVTVYVYIAAGGKNDITVNRIVANATGIAMAIVMAVIPPGLYGGNPKFANASLDEMKQTLLKGLRLVLEHANSKQDEQSAEKLGTEIDDVRTNGRAEISSLLSEADDFYKDSSRFQRLPCFRVDPDLKDCIDSFRVLEAWINVVLGYASHNLKDADLQNSFMTGVRSSTRLRAFVEELDSASSQEQAMETPKLLDQNACKAAEGAYGSYESAVFVHYVLIACRKIHKYEKTLSGIKWGAFS